MGFFYTVSRRLSELFMQPFELYKAGVVDRYMVGMMNQVSQAVDEALTGEVYTQLKNSQTISESSIIRFLLTK